MAKIKQGILGGFSGKVANVVGTSWKGRAVMKSQPLSVANPRTTAQVEQRNKFSYIAELASTILTQFVQPVENPISGDISGYNLFCKDNKQAFNSVGELSANNLVAGGGKIANLTGVSLSWNEGGDPTINWSAQSELPVLRQNDNVYCVLLNTEGKLLAVSSGNAKRSSLSLLAETTDLGNEQIAGTNVIILFACVSADGRDVSIKTNATTGVIS